VGKKSNWKLFELKSAAIENVVTKGDLGWPLLV
jgi:hypothetical protein